MLLWWFFWWGSQPFAWHIYSGVCICIYIYILNCKIYNDIILDQPRPFRPRCQCQAMNGHAPSQASSEASPCLNHDPYDCMARRKPNNINSSTTSGKHGSNQPSQTSWWYVVGTTHISWRTCRRQPCITQLTKQRALISSSKSCDKKSASGRMCVCVWCPIYQPWIWPEMESPWVQRLRRSPPEIASCSPTQSVFLTTLAHIFLGSISASIAVNINNELLIYLIYHLGIAQLRRIGAHCCPSQRWLAPGVACNIS